MCLDTGDFLWPQGAIPPGFFTLRGGLPGAPNRGMPTGPKDFWPCWTREGFGPATGPTLKTALCHIRALVGRYEVYADALGRLCAAFPLQFLGCIP